MSKSPGWQQPPTSTCLHLGAAFAALSISRHAEGHEWVCTCGQQFVVVSNGDEGKRLVPRNRVR